MNIQDAPAIEVLETSDLLFERESGRTHTPYETELLFYSCIRGGSVERAAQMMRELLSQTVVAGRLSNNALRQTKYWACCCITLATRYAIQGGLDETTAFNLSDSSILKIDEMQNSEAILLFLQSLCLELTALVGESRRVSNYPAVIRRVIHYIHAHLHNRLTLQELAGVCGLSPDYLSRLFQKSVGLSVRAYIKQERLSAACELLETDKSTSEIAYLLGFCSESYFIQCFRETYGKTPGAMRKENC